MSALPGALRYCQCGKLWVSASHAERAGHTPLGEIESAANILAAEVTEALRAEAVPSCPHLRTVLVTGPEPWNRCGGHGDCVDSGPCDCPCVSCLDCGGHLYAANLPGHGHGRGWRPW